jgi:hypothetical protein
MPHNPLPFQGEGDLNIGRTAVCLYGTPSPLGGGRAGDGGLPGAVRHWLLTPNLPTVRRGAGDMVIALWALSL